MSTADVTRLFLDGAHAVTRALTDPAVGSAWDRPSVLAGQLVSGVAGHLARGGVWVVADYLAAGSPPGPADLESADEYFAWFAGAATPEAHQGIRERGASVAAVGHEALVAQLVERLDDLESTLPSTDPNSLVTVASGNVMRVADYLMTRIVEQVVHLDDLAQSIDRDPWDYPAAGQDIALDVAIKVAVHEHGAPAVLRALYRRGAAAEVLPVL